MALSEEKVRGYIKRLLLSRMRILVSHGFYGLLLMHMQFALDPSCETAATDGIKIYFGPQFLEDLSDSELDFVMMHEIMHVVLQHCLRGTDCDSEQFNIACDIVVNSNILLSNGMDTSTITLKKYGEAMHVAPDGKEGHEYTAEQVYHMLPKKKSASGAGGVSGAGGASSGKGKGSSQNGASSGASGNGGAGGAQSRQDGGFDDHGKWGTYSDDAMLRDVWVKRFEDACEAISIREQMGGHGDLPLFAKRIFNELKRPQTDWRTILNDFVQENIVDYSFTPPDRRFSESPFFLPDFNAPEDAVENILFMIDTSGSMTDDMITAAYSEVKGAIDQFDGKLKGWLGFFDAAIIEPKPFASEEEFRVIKPAGGGGTNFAIIFEYVRRYMQDNLPVSIIILTDGDAAYPKQEAAMGIPVLWILNNTKITPPWGKIARITL